MTWSTTTSDADLTPTHTFHWSVCIVNVKLLLLSQILWIGVALHHLSLAAQSDEHLAAVKHVQVPEAFYFCW